VQERGTGAGQSRTAASTASRAITRYVVYFPTATGHQRHPRHRRDDRVLMRELARGIGLARQQRPQPGVHTDDVVCRQRPDEDAVDLLEQVADVAAARRGVRQVQIPRRVRRADQPVRALPWDDEQDRACRRGPSARVLGAYRNLERAAPNPPESGESQARGNPTQRPRHKPAALEHSSAVGVVPTVSGNRVRVLSDHIASRAAADTSARLRCRSRSTKEKVLSSHTCVL